MPLSSFLESLDIKPGNEWTDQETRRVQEWWLERPQLRIIRQYAALYLGQEATRQDIEDALLEFYHLIEPARRSYLPGSLSFRAYLLHVCFKHYCLKEARRLKRRRQQEQPLGFIFAHQEIVEIDMKDTSPDSDPFHYAGRKAFATDLARWLNLPDLPNNIRQTFLLRYFHDLSYEEIAHQMDAPLGSVKGWLHRANLRAASYLKQRGWNDAF